MLPAPHPTTSPGLVPRKVLSLPVPPGELPCLSPSGSADKKKADFNPNTRFRSNPILLRGWTGSCRAFSPGPRAPMGWGHREGATPRWDAERGAPDPKSYLCRTVGLLVPLGEGVAPPIQNPPPWIAPNPRGTNLGPE